MAKRIIIGFLVFITSFALFFFFWIPGFLAFHHPIKSSYILLEGWLPSYEVEQAVAHYYIPGQTHFVICGKNFQSTDKDILSEAKNYFSNHKEADTTFNEGIWLLTNSSLFFRLDPSIFPSGPRDSTRIEFRIKGSIAIGYSAHYQIYMDGNRLAQDFAPLNETTILLYGKWSTRHFPTICIQFDNDLKTETEDWNLKVISMKINGQEFPLNSKNVFYRKHEDLSVYGFSSETGKLSNYLQSLGVNEKAIIPLQFDAVDQNQTLMAAQESAHWVRKNNITSINIVSSGIHSRRSWISYQRSFPKNAEVGIICFSGESSNQEQLFYSFTGIKSAMEELSAYVWNWVQLSTC